MSKLLIIGAKGFAKELLECVMQGDPACAVTFFDEISSDLPDLMFDRFPILRNDEEVVEYFADNGPYFALGIGNPVFRAGLFERFTNLGGVPKTIISPYAQIGKFNNEIGEATCVLSNAVIESSNKIGRGSLLHVGVLISHDVCIGEFSEISPRANLLGNVYIGDRCRIGTGTVLLPGVKLGNEVTVGAGAVVTMDVGDKLTVVGVPARSINNQFS